MIEDFEKVKRTFESCESYDQFYIAKRMLYNFFVKYSAEFTATSRMHTMQQMEQTMNDCILRFNK